MPKYLQDRYATTFYGSGDLEPKCLDVYLDCCSRLEKLLLFKAEKRKGGSIVIMSGEGMVALWGGLKSVIPWPFHYDPEGNLVQQESADRGKYRVLCVGNGVYGCGMFEMVKSLRYPNVAVRAVDSEWDQPVDVEKVVETIQEWKPDLVTSNEPWRGSMK